MAIKTIALASLALAATFIGIYFMIDNTKSDKTYYKQFLQHKHKFAKSYNNKEDLEFRYAVYANNMKQIQDHNAKKSSFTMAENMFTDLTFEEFKSKYLSTEILHNEMTSINQGVMDTDSKDWNAEGKVSKVKNQGQCGSCWAFSTTGSLESAYAIFKNQSIEASEQELVDCSKAQGNQGCNGGLMSSAFDYIIKKQISKESDYIYTARDGTCKANQYKDKYTVKSYNVIKPVDVTGLVSAIKVQPVSVAIEVQSDFMHYHDGIYTNKNCGKSLNHGVLAVGYNNNTTNDLPYFLVKNSWSEQWGNKGYIKMAIATGSGTCGIANKWDVIPHLD